MSVVPSTVARDRDGWLESFKPPHVSFAAFLRERLRLTIKDSTFEPLEVIYGAGCAYVALQETKKGRKPVVRGVVAQVEHLSGLAGAANIAWRILDEEKLGQSFTYSDGRRSQIAGRNATFGRVFSRCPRSVLEKFTETSNVGALSWRKTCWMRVHANESLRRRPLARGDIAVPESMKFEDGAERESFLITQSDPLQGIAFGVGSKPMVLASVARLLTPAPKADLDMIPDEEAVEVLTASQGDCIGYLIRTTETKRIVGATRDAATAITFERQWNASEATFDFSAMAAGAQP